MGRVFAISDSRNGPGDGDRQIVVERLGSVWRNSGLLTAVLVEFGRSSFLYPLTVHGKPRGFFTVPAFFPIMFELTVLFAAFSAFFAWQIMNRLPRWNHPMFNWERFSRVTNDGFFLTIEARDPRFTENGVYELLEQTGGEHITIVHED